MDYRTTAMQSLASSPAEAEETVASFDEPVEEFQADSDLYPFQSSAEMEQTEEEQNSDLPEEATDNSTENPVQAGEPEEKQDTSQFPSEGQQNKESETPLDYFMFNISKDERNTLKRKEQEDRQPASENNTIAEDVDHSGMPVENDPKSAAEGKAGPLGTPDDFGITQFMQSWDAMCGRYTDNDQCIPSCPFYSETVEGNCVISQFPKTDALLSWCSAVLQKYMQNEASEKSRRIDVMMQLVPGFSEEYLSEAGKCTALDHVDRPKEDTEKTWLDLLREALPGFDEREFSEAGLKALKQKIHR